MNVLNPSEDIQNNQSDPIFPVTLTFMRCILRGFLNTVTVVIFSNDVELNMFTSFKWHWPWDRLHSNLDVDAVVIYMNMKSSLKFGNCNDRLKLILVTCKQFCLPKRCLICYKKDFQNPSTIVAFIPVAQGTLQCLSQFYTSHLRRIDRLFSFDSHLLNLSSYLT